MAMPALTLPGRQTIYEVEKHETHDSCAIQPRLDRCDYFLFPKFQNQLRGQQFSSSEEAAEEYEKRVSEDNTDGWNKCYKNLFIRMKKFIDAHGEYFEKY